MALRRTERRQDADGDGGGESRSGAAQRPDNGVGRGKRRYAVRDNRHAAGGGCRIRTDARTGESRVRGRGCSGPDGDGRRAGRTDLDGGTRGGDCRMGDARRGGRQDYGYRCG